MSEKPSKQQTKKPAQIESGKFYISKADVWGIDTTKEDFIQVYVRDQIFKMKPEQLVYLEETCQKI